MQRQKEQLYVRELHEPDAFDKGSHLIFLIVPQDTPRYPPRLTDEETKAQRGLAERQERGSSQVCQLREHCSFQS